MQIGISQKSGYHNPIQFDHGKLGNERRDALRNGTSQATSERHMLSQVYDAVVLELGTNAASLNENERLTSEFFFQLGGLGGFANGIEGGMAAFEQLHAEIMNNYEGEERYLRIAALEQAFEDVAQNHAIRVAFFIQTQSNDFRSGALSGDDWEAHKRSVDLFEKVKHNIISMMRSALNFFRANGSFTGFADTDDADRHGQLSFHDVEHIFAIMDNASNPNGSQNSISLPELSDSGREFLSGFGF